MSSSGINAINSGPLIIRSYFGSSINNTYALGDNDIPISSNRVLVTSTNGLVTPSDNIYISSITISSINGLPYAPGDDVFWSSTSSNGSIVNDNTGSVQINTFLQCSTITDVSTINGLPYPPQDDTFWSSTLSGGDIVNTNTGIVNISTALIVDGSLSTLRIFDNAGSLGTTGQVLTAGTVLGGQVIWSSTLNLLSISTTSISATSISTSTINGLPYPPQNDTFWTSTLSSGIVNTNTGNVNISTALNVDGSILTNTSYTLYNVAGTYGTLSITPSTAAGFPGNGYINCDFLTFRTANSGGAFLSLNTNTSMMNVQGTLSTLSIRDNNGSTGTSGYVLTAGTGGQVIWNIPAVSNYPYIWQYYKVTDQTLSSAVGGDGTWISWDGVNYEQPGYTGLLTNSNAVYNVPLDGWYQITFVGALCGAVTGSQGDIPQGGTWPSFAAGLISQFTYGIRLNTLTVPGWQGYLNGYVVLEACGVQTQLVVIKYLVTGNTILVDNETAVVAGAGDFAAGIGTTLTITYLRP